MNILKKKNDLKKKKYFLVKKKLELNSEHILIIFAYLIFHEKIKNQRYRYS